MEHASTRAPTADSRETFAREAWIRALQRVAGIEQHPHLTLPVLIGQLAEQHAAAPALEAGEEIVTYQALTQRCNQYAHWGIAQGLKAGDAACLVMSNCTDYLAVWLGLTRLGVSVALVNANLNGELLAQAINAVDPRLVIVGATEAAALASARGTLPAALACWVRGPTSVDLAGIEAELHAQPVDPLSESQWALPSINSTALYIYTSGTTGLPKAAKVSHQRVLQWSHWFAGMLDTGPKDRMYNCLPFYHSIGGVVANAAPLLGGGTVVIRKRFSASDFWRDIGAARCTLFQYIGELCRYLVNSPPHPAETEHSLRIACGNGLRPDVWQTFQTRFRIPRILEYYAATEGTFSLYNCEGEPGAIGRIPAYLRNRLPVELLRVDATSGEPWRDAAGFCQRCAVDETGEAIGAGRFEGYVDVQASERKMLRNVFKAGDAWYRTGDLMRRDARGFYYFVDRVGDAYRWKGENISVAQVLSVVLKMPGVREALVYGVTVPGGDGRAGMAALVVDAAFDLKQFRAQLAELLPSYARPVFLRLLPQMPITSTFKPIARDLIRASFDPAQVADPLFFDSAAAGAYLALDAAAYAAILEGKVRL